MSVAPQLRDEARAMVRDCRILFGVGAIGPNPGEHLPSTRLPTGTTVVDTTDASRRLFAEQLPFGVTGPTPRPVIDS